MLTVRNLEVGLTVSDFLATVKHAHPVLLHYQQRSTVQYDLYFATPMDSLWNFIQQHIDDDTTNSSSPADHPADYSADHPADHPDDHPADADHHTITLSEHFLSLVEYEQYWQEIERFGVDHVIEFRPIVE